MTYATSLFFNRHNKLETSLLLPLRDVVLLPGTTLPVVAGKPRSIAVAESAAMTENKQLIVAAIRPQTLQKLSNLENQADDLRSRPEIESLEEIYPIATLAVIHKMLPLPMGLVQLIVEGLERHVPPPLLDRLEIIKLSGYSPQEKTNIALKYLLPRQIDKAGLPDDAVQLPKSTIERAIESYTHEAGVRKLEQQLGTICRKVAVRYAHGETEPQLIDPEQLEEILGAKQFLKEEIRPESRPGVATGLAWTLQGGEILFIEAVLLPQGTDLTLTGQLGEVMQESAEIARSYLWSQAESLGIDPSVFKDNGLHIHVPAGAIQKDGPSAGVTMITAIASLLMHKSVRNDTAMTGEVNLSGEVLPIGGVREKVLAAHRLGIKRVILPRLNQKDLVDVPEDVRGQIEFIFGDRIERVLANALVNYQEVISNRSNGNSKQIKFVGTN